MANAVAVASANLTTASTWGTTSAAANANLVSTSASQTALTTANLDSATFVPAASQIDGFFFRLASRASGSPSNKLTIILRDSTSGVDKISCVINVSDLPAADTTNDQGGWYYVKATTPFTPNGTDSYLIRAKLDSTSTAVSLSTNGTANNWQRLIVLHTTGAPAVGDDMFISQQFNENGASAATITTRSVTMDQTATTDYGSDSTNARQPALLVGKGATLTYNTTGSPLLQLSGHLVVYSGGTLNIGTTGSPFTGTLATLQFDCSSDNRFGLIAKDGSTVSIVGSPRTAGKNVTWGLLGADAAAAATSLTIVDTSGANLDTGWKNGDGIAIASTTRTASQGETKTLNADATSGSLSTSAGLTNAHGGSLATKVTAEVILTTRNVIVKSDQASFTTFFTVLGTAIVTCKWTSFDTLGNATNHGIWLQGTGAVTIQYCHFTNGTRDAFAADTANNWTLDNCTFWNAGTAATARSVWILNTQAGTSWSITNNVVLFNASSLDGFFLQDFNGTVTGNRAGGCGGNGFSLSQSLGAAPSTNSGGSFADNVAHCCGTAGLSNVQGGSTTAGAPFANVTITRMVSWRNSSFGIMWGNGTTTDAAVLFNVNVIDPTLFGNATANLIIRVKSMISCSMYGTTATGCKLAGDSSFATVSGIKVNTNVGDTGLQFIELNIYNATFGVASSIYVAHTNDFLFTTTTDNYVVRIKMNNVNLASGTPVNNLSALLDTSYITSSKDGQVAGAHKVYFPQGSTALSSQAVNGSSFSQKMTPTSASIKVKSGIRQYRVSSGATLTPSVYARKDGTYNGNQPRLILLANPALGVFVDTVIYTMTVGLSTDEQLTGTTAAATDDGVFQFYVDCDGTAGNAYIAGWS